MRKKKNTSIEAKRITLLTRIKNAIHAFKCEPTPAIRFGVDVKRCSECEYKGNRSDVLYLCDGLRCERHGEIGHCSGICKLTTDVHHARNFAYNAETGCYEEKSESRN